ncbi:unnamed protein product [Closterium sp. NIES-53]
MSSSHCTSSTSAATRRSRASPSRSDGTPLPLNSNRTLEIHLSAAAAGHDGAYCGVTTCTSDVTVASAATDVATPSCRSPTTILDFPASPSVSAFPHAAFPMSPCADSIPWSSNSARFSLIDGEPFPAAAPCGSSAEAGAGTAAGNVALEDWRPCCVIEKTAAGAAAAAAGGGGGKDSRNAARTAAVGNGEKQLIT